MLKEIIIQSYFVFREHGWEPSAVEAKLKELQEKGLVKAMDHGAFTRVVHEDTQVQVIYYLNIIVFRQFLLTYMYRNAIKYISRW